MSQIIVYVITLTLQISKNTCRYRNNPSIFFLQFHVLIAQALMSHYKLNPVTRWISHKNKSRFHGVLQLVGGTMVLLGAVGKFSNKDVHFNTWHGRFGECVCGHELIN